MLLSFGVSTCAAVAHACIAPSQADQTSLHCCDLSKNLWLTDELIIVIQTGCKMDTEAGCHTRRCWLCRLVCKSYSLVRPCAGRTLHERLRKFSQSTFLHVCVSLTHLPAHSLSSERRLKGTMLCQGLAKNTTTFGTASCVDFVEDWQSVTV